MSNSEREQSSQVFRGRPLAHSDVLDAVLAHLASVVEAGEPLVPGLKEAAEQLEDTGLRPALLAVAGQLEQGYDLPAALHQLGAPAIVPAVVEAAQRSGRVGEILQQFVQHRRRLVQVQRQLVGALTYPAILFLLTVGFGGMLLGIFAPQFDSMYRDFGTELPDLTRWLLNAGLFLREHGLLLAAVVLAAVLFVAAYCLFSREPASLIDMVSRVPRIGRITGLVAGWNLRLAEQAWLARLLASLLRCEVPLPEAFDLAAPAAQNHFNRAACLRMADDLRRGEQPWREDFSSGARQHIGSAETPDQAAELLEAEARELRQFDRQRKPRRSIFSSGLLQYLHGSATTGEAADMLDLQADIFDSRAIRRVSIVQILAEPLLVVLIGMGIGISILLLLTPLFRLTSTLA